MLDFFTSPCKELDACCKSPGVICKYLTEEVVFGICDEPPPDFFPAYIKCYQKDDWIAEVRNSGRKPTVFKAIDNCLPLRKPDGTLDSRCDGVLATSNVLIFLELKDRDTPGWLREGWKQIVNTIRHFVLTHSIDDFQLQVAHVCNKQRPFSVSGINTEAQEFKDETSEILNNKGLLLVADRIIII